MESKANRLLEQISVNAETLEADFEFMREFGLNQTRKNIEDLYGKELARFISYEDFSLTDLADFEREQGVGLDDDKAYVKIADILLQLGESENTSSSRAYRDIFKEKLPIELLFAVSYHLEMVADQLEDNRDIPTVELINSYLDMRVCNIKEESEPVDAELFPEL